MIKEVEPQLISKPSGTITFDIEAKMRLNVGEQKFEVDDKLLIQYKESILAKCTEDATCDEEILIDRDPKYSQKVFDFMKDPSSLPFHRMSNIELAILHEEAKFYAIDKMVRICERELGLATYQRIDTITDCNELEKILASETRYVILLNDGAYLSTREGQTEVIKILPLVNRDKCLLLGFDGSFRDHSNMVDGDCDGPYCIPIKIFFYDTRKAEVLIEFRDETAEALASCTYLANSDIPRTINWVPGDWEEPEEDRVAYFKYIPTS